MRRKEAEFLASFLVESDAIEGINNDYETVRVQFLGVGRGKSSTFKGHAGALLMLRKLARAFRKQFLNEELVKLTQLFIVQEQHLKGERKLPVSQRGQWRTCAVEMVGRNTFGDILWRKPIGPLWEDVPKEMLALLNKVRSWQAVKSRNQSDSEKVRFVARFHYRYERIHPFVDGNGRSGRALVYFLYRFVGLEPFIFTNSDKRENYYPCFGEKDSLRMERYFFERSPATR